MNGIDERVMPEIAPDTGAVEKPRLEQCVPTSAVSVPEEGEQMAEPEPGDTVRYEVEGKVSRVAGGHVYVDPVSINGQPVEEKPDEPVDELAGLQEEAGMMDQGGRY